MSFIFSTSTKQYILNPSLLSHSQFYTPHYYTPLLTILTNTHYSILTHLSTPLTSLHPSLFNPSLFYQTYYSTLLTNLHPSLFYQTYYFTPLTILHPSLFYQTYYFTVHNSKNHYSSLTHDYYKLSIKKPLCSSRKDCGLCWSRV